MELRGLVRTGSIQEAVDFFGQRGSLSVACLIDGRHHAFSSSRNGWFSANTRVNIGCVVKNLTALLVAFAAADGHLDFEGDVGNYLPEFQATNPKLRVWHLLSCSHGLDGSMIDDLPYTRHGAIDASMLWRAVSQVPAVSRPGSIFYYRGSVGYWIAAAILERIYRRRYVDLLRERILREIDLSARMDNNVSVCPSSGGLFLSAQELLRLCDIHLHHFRKGDPANAIQMLGAQSKVPLPRWPPVGSGVGLGWFHYAGATLGSVGPSAMILISPNENAALAMTGSSQMFASQGLFGPLTLTHDTERPRLLTKQECGEIDLRRFVGVFRKASLTLKISFDPGGRALRAHVHRGMRSGGYEAQPLVERMLLPAVDNTFYPAMPEPQVIPFVRFEATQEAGFITHAVNGVHVFRRVGISDDL